MWVNFDKKAVYQKIFQSDGIIYARNVFNSSISWNTKDKSRLEQNKSTSANEILLLLKEDEVRDEVKVRTEQQNRTLTIKRRISLFLSSVVLVIGWGMIYLGTVYENEINDWSLATINS